MDDIYCVKCKCKTKNTKVTIIKTEKSNRASCRCKVCDSLKSSFLKKC